ncbi:putative conjugative transfer protein TraY (plasmid) [Vibrio vulnificus YJ016]|uniref:Relaxosome protein TraY n=2 Tax=Vibrio vulnificus TaxID=672 RepID=Q7MBP1_VIBVY|nr:TraY domain-containing protein [Vibrio vulnificus]EWS69288.1 conjugal transfer protein TraY [Vibrio vulnificus BAA87]EGQ8079029.1 TraY domain-containing protein [Vibrio vulnificus]EGR0791320.1 TraY domain-containing protein [Vibrio vulnificus]EGR0799584.1 TraY domain-containing protein [Vibrio vulnificus]EGR0817337.1 TraY domain-containing protein [Vibrio vulnificus]
MPSKDDMTGIWFEMDKETNQRLEASAKENKRTKRQEASFRLSHHLTHFDEHMKPRTKN